MMIHVNEIKFEETDAWTRQFNKCSDEFKKWDEAITEEEKKEAWDNYCHERWFLEQGGYKWK